MRDCSKEGAAFFDSGGLVFLCSSISRESGSSSIFSSYLLKIVFLTFSRRISQSLTFHVLHFHFSFALDWNGKATAASSGKRRLLAAPVALSDLSS